MAFTVRWLGQGGFLVRAGAVSIAIDPYLTDDIFLRTGMNKRQRPIPIEPEALKCDALITTHDHDDHLDPATLSRTNLDLYAGPDSCISHMRELSIKEKALFPFNRGDVLRLGDAVLYGIFADHTEDSIGVVVKYDGLTAYFSGDTLHNEKLIDIGALGIDIAFLCINGRLGNMNHLEAAQLANALPCRIAIPHHYDMFQENTADPEDFRKALLTSGISMVLPVFDAEIDLFDCINETRKGY